MVASRSFSVFFLGGKRIKFHDFHQCLLDQFQMPSISGLVLVSTRLLNPNIRISNHFCLAVVRSYPHLKTFWVWLTFWSSWINISMYLVSDQFVTVNVAYVRSSVAAVELANCSGEWVSYTDLLFEGVNQSTRSDMALLVKEARQQQHSNSASPTCMSCYLMGTCLCKRKNAISFKRFPPLLPCPKCPIYRSFLER